ncbi:hypothetical protein D3C76_1231570 [compost metagenome]
MQCNELKLCINEQTTRRTVLGIGIVTQARLQDRRPKRYANPHSHTHSDARRVLKQCDLSSCCINPRLALRIQFIKTSLAPDSRLEANDCVVEEDVETLRGNVIKISNGN